MSKPAAKLGDSIKAQDIHNAINPDGSIVPQVLNFDGKIVDGCINNVQINGKPTAVEGSKAKNLPPHVQLPPATSFQKPPMNEGEVIMGSETVLIGGKSAARGNDIAETCTDVIGAPAMVVVAGNSNVFIGG